MVQVAVSEVISPVKTGLMEAKLLGSQWRGFTLISFTSLLVSLESTRQDTEMETTGFLGVKSLLGITE